MKTDTEIFSGQLVNKMCHSAFRYKNKSFSHLTQLFT